MRPAGETLVARLPRLVDAAVELSARTFLVAPRPRYEWELLPREHGGRAVTERNPSLAVFDGMSEGLRALLRTAFRPRPREVGPSCGVAVVDSQGTVQRPGQKLSVEGVSALYIAL